jgi:hypothetical protein
MHGLHNRAKIMLINTDIVKELECESGYDGYTGQGSCKNVDGYNCLRNTTHVI